MGSSTWSRSRDASRPARAALVGALEGALLGAFFGLLMGLIFTYDPNPARAAARPLRARRGRAVGAALGALLHAATGGTRDFTSVPGLQAQRYEVVVDEDVADRAAEQLGAVD